MDAAAELEGQKIPAQGDYKGECIETYAHCLYQLGDAGAQSAARRVIQDRVITRPLFKSRAAEIKKRYGIP